MLFKNGNNVSDMLFTSQEIGYAKRYVFLHRSLPAEKYPEFLVPSMKLGSTEFNIKNFHKENEQGVDLNKISQHGHFYFLHRASKFLYILWQQIMAQILLSSIISNFFEVCDFLKFLYYYLERVK